MGYPLNFPMEGSHNKVSGNVFHNYRLLSVSFFIKLIIDYSLLDQFEFPKFSIKNLPLIYIWRNFTSLYLFLLNFYY